MRSAGETVHNTCYIDVGFRLPCLGCVSLGSRIGWGFPTQIGLRAPPHIGVGTRGHVFMFHALVSITYWQHAHGYRVVLAARKIYRSNNLISYSLCWKWYTFFIVS